MKPQSLKINDGLMSLISLFVLVCSLYFQYVQGLSPCPLCLMQRLAVILLVISSSVLFFLRHASRCALLIVVQIGVSLFGLFFASRQLWLQSMPPGTAPSCLPDFEMLIRYFPLRDILHALFWGAEDCAEAPWHWLGLSMAGWAALYFMYMILGTLYALLAGKNIQASL